jgi:hypothetical protein
MSSSRTTLLRRAPGRRAPALRRGPGSARRAHGAPVARPAPLPLLPLLVLSAVGFASVSTELLPAGLLPDIGASFGVSESAAGLLTAATRGSSWSASSRSSP